MAFPGPGSRCSGGPCPSLQQQQRWVHRWEHLRWMVSLWCLEVLLYIYNSPVTGSKAGRQTANSQLPAAHARLGQPTHQWQ